MKTLNPQKIEAMIYTIRGQRVMLDSDLATLYGVDTRHLGRQVRRNLNRFPEDFMFQPNSSELDDLRCQFGTANSVSSWNHKRRTVPMLFTENGVAMLSSVLGSDRAIEVNIAIIRTFTKLRSFIAMENTTDKRIEELEKGTHKLFKIVFERLDSIENIIEPKLSPNRKKIGLRTKD